MSEQKLPDIVERLRAEATTIEYQVRGQDPGDWKEIGLMREAASQIERLRASSIGWEEAIEAAAKVADETAALEDKHDRYEAYRAAHYIAQTIRSLRCSPAPADGEGLREALEQIVLITASGRTTELLAKMAQINALARAALSWECDGACMLPPTGMCPERERLRAINAELVAALEGIAECVDGGSEDIDDWCEQARAALARAKEARHG